MAVRDLWVVSRHDALLALAPAPPAVRRRHIARALPSRTGGGLLRSLITLDVVGVTVAWSLALLRLKPPTGASLTGASATQASDLAPVVVLLLPVALALLAAQRLYRARVCSVRAVETEGLIRAALLTAVLAWAVGGHRGVTVQDAAVGAGLMFMLLRGLRSAFSGYLQSGRRKGRFSRPVVLVGANEEADGLFRLLTQHPELGFRIVGFVGKPGQDQAFPVPFLGTVDDTEIAVDRIGATGVIVAATALESTQLNRLTRELTGRSIHVHLSSGVRGIAQSRLRAQPMAHEPLFYVEPPDRAAWHAPVKRGIDVVLASLALVLAFPVLVVAALAVKLHDGGPVLFCQPRVGRGGRHFTFLKLRTMVPDAEGQYHRLAMTKAGRGGPLVKLTDDPRITRVGHWLRASSIDELPQLLNVLTGSMSMVGPRPNLLVEAAGLDPDFLAMKGTVRPGITGLWQVEGRDNPSFEVYRRLDLFYLENRSMRLDAFILLATLRKVLGRALRLLLPAGLKARFGVVEPATLS